jgi:hypothetical protein
MKEKNEYTNFEKDIDYLIFKNFTFVLKKHKMYPIFRCLVGTNTKNSVTSIYLNMPSFSRVYARQIRDNIFRNAGNFGMFIHIMKQTFNGVKNESPEEIQRHVADSVNNLLHLFIEPQVRRFEVLEELGEEMFNLTCREFFGGDFEDKLPKPQNLDMEKIKQINEMIHNQRVRITPEIIREMNRIIDSGGGLGELSQAFSAYDSSYNVLLDDTDGADDDYNEYEEPF